MKYYLGLIGASKISRLALANESGEIISNIQTLPLTIRVNPNIRKSLEQAFYSLAKSSKLSYQELVKNLNGACIAMSGVFYESDRSTLSQILNQLAFHGEFPCTVCEDVNAHLAANFLEEGGVVIGGTGTNVFLKSKNIDEPIRVDGWGSDIGDDGGGYDLGRKCLRALFKGYDGRKTRIEKLEKNVLNHVGLYRLEDLVQWYYNVRSTVNWRSEIADLAIPLRVTAEVDNDPSAIKIVTKGAQELFKTFKTANRLVSSNFNLPNPCPIILEGGLFETSKIYNETFNNNINELNNNNSKIKWEIKYPMYTPVVGALALAICGKSQIDNTNKVLDTLRSSADLIGLRKMKGDFGGNLI